MLNLEITKLRAVADMLGDTAEGVIVRKAAALIETFANPSDEALMAAGEPYGGNVDRATGLQVRREAFGQIIAAMVAGK